MTPARPRAASPEATVTCLGIDPGLDGGIAWIRPGEDAHAVITPTIRLANGKRDFDRRAMIVILDQFAENSFVAIEKVNAAPMRGRVQGTTSMFSFGCGYGLWLGMIETLSFDFVEVDPKKWKAAILAGTKRDKDAAIEYARRFYPSVSLLPTPRCKKPHDGICDALCIAEYARQAWRIRELVSGAKR
jgi:hypothetical protein